MKYSSPFSLEERAALHRQIDTPALLIAEPRLQNNLRAMQRLAGQNKVRLRPHIKTHKSVELARRQLAAGARGVTVAKLSEAEVMLNAGINDIFIANQITQPRKIKKLKALAERGHIIVGLGHPAQIGLLSAEFSGAQKPLNVRLEIDSGLRRCGVPANAALIELAREVQRRSWLNLEGIFTHAGQVYGVHDRARAEQIGQAEGQIMAHAKALLVKQGISIQTVSVGSTPTVPFSAQNPDVNEIRPGNYLFNDAMQMHIHQTPMESCSLFVLSTVISRPAADRLIIDAGSKALHTDGQSLTGRFGLVLDVDGAVERLSEEHGILTINPQEDITIGQPLLIIPNHACAVVNLFDYYWLVEENLQLSKTAISARGKSQ